SIPMGHSINAYDVGNLTGLKDADLNLTTCAYDAANRKTATTDPRGNVATFLYDAVGNMTSTTDGAGGRRDLTYTLRNELYTDDWFDSGGNTVDSRSFSYDGNDNLAAVASNSQGTYDFYYDAV